MIEYTDQKDNFFDVGVVVQEETGKLIVHWWDNGQFHSIEKVQVIL